MHCCGVERFIPSRYFAAFFKENDMVKLKKIKEKYYVYVNWFDGEKTLMFSHENKENALEYAERAKRIYEEAHQVSERLYKNIYKKKEKV
jgi:hypothetical protein